MEWSSDLGLLIGVISSLLAGLIAARFSKAQKKSLEQSREVFKKTQQEYRN